MHLLSKSRPQQYKDRWNIALAPKNHVGETGVWTTNGENKYEEVDDFEGQ